jgi:excisionase family DNA binding protein
MILERINDDKLYSPKEVAELFGVSLQSVYFWINDKRLKAMKIGRRWFVDGKSLKEFVKTNLE